MKKLLIIAVIVFCAVGLFLGPSEEELHQHDISAEETAKMVNNKVNENRINNLIANEKESKVWSYK